MKIKIISMILLFATCIYAATTRVTDQNKAYLSDSGSSNKIGLQPPSLSSSWNFTFPTSAGTSGQVLSTDGNGVTSWVSSSGGANTTLSNLTSPTSINQSLLPSTDNSFSIGDATNRFKIYGSYYYDNSNNAIMYGDSTTRTLYDTTFSSIISFNSTASGVTINGDLKPSVNNSKNLGTSALSWANSYMYNLNLKGPTSGTLTLNAAATTTSHTLTFPATQGSANQVLTNNGSGGLSWTSSSGGLPTGGSVGQLIYNTSSGIGTWVTPKNRTTNAVRTRAVSTWTTRTSAADLAWTSITWSPELSLFAAVNNNGAVGTSVMTSPDGITWTIRTVPIALNWTAITWAPELGLFVAAAATSTLASQIMTSPDGITWTSRTGSAATIPKAIAWSPDLGLLVVTGAILGTNIRVMTSPDGITWTTRTSAADINWNGVCWSPELSLFVAVGNGTTATSVMTSPDGITWTLRTSPSSSVNWQSVAWSPELNLFVAVNAGIASTAVMTSPDGINWTTRTASSTGWTSVVWSAELGLFTASSTAVSTSDIMTSPDGINWTTRTLPNTNGISSLSWSPELGIFAGVSQNGTGIRVMTSKHVKKFY